MERLRQVVGAEGLQIPLPIMLSMGAKEGTGVVLELESNRIRVLPVAKSKEEIENMALRTLLKHLGDAVRVSVAQSPKGWDVSVYTQRARCGTGLSKPLGQLIYTPAGELLPHCSTSFEMMRNVALEAFANL